MAVVIDSTSLSVVHMPLVHPSFLLSPSAKQCICLLGFLPGMTVENIMLDEEYGIVQDGDVSERELDGIACDAGPVMLQVTVDSLLGDAQETAREVEEDLVDTPPDSRFVTVVEENLGRILDECHDELDIRDGVDGV